jgi:hypothetical protein
MTRRNLALGIVPLLTAALILGAIMLPAPAGASSNVFITQCDTSHTKQVDPIVAPGTTSAHVHEFFGNETTDANSTYQSMTAGGTTCTLSDDTAGYWVPALIAPDGSMARAQRTNAYYRVVGNINPADVAPFPPDLRMVSYNYFWHCGDTGVGTKQPQDCGSESLHLSISFPSCWDGKNTDSADHMSHMAFQSGRGCPASHPIAVPRLVLIVRYLTVHDGRGYYPALSNGMQTPEHGDFWNTWHQDALVSLVHRCINAATTRCGTVS